MNPGDINYADNLPEQAVTLQPKHALAAPGDSIAVQIVGGESLASKHITLQLIDGIGRAVVNTTVDGHIIELAIPPDAEIGEYALCICDQKWHLDSVPFELVGRQSVSLTQNLLAATSKQAEAFDFLSPDLLDVKKAMVAATEAERFYKAAGEARLGEQTWLEMASVLAHLGNQEEAREALARATDSSLPDRQRTRIAAKLPVVRGAILRSGGAKQDAAGFYIGEKHLRRYLEATRSVMTIGSHVPILYFGDKGSRQRGSLGWALHRLAGDVLSGLLTDLVEFRAQGLPHTTVDSLQDALIQTEDVLGHLSSQSVAIPRAIAELDAFKNSFQSWAAVHGQEWADIESRDNSWDEMRRIRQRLVRKIGKVHWDQVVLGDNSLRPGIVVSPFVKVVGGDPSLIKTMLAVVRIVGRMKINDNSQGEGVGRFSKG